MTSPSSENASSTNKRRRRNSDDNDDEDTDPDNHTGLSQMDHGSTNNFPQSDLIPPVPPVPTTVTKLVKGTRLEPLATVLATQPNVLHDTIIDCSKSMLKGADNIRQRLLSHSRFKSKVTVRDADGNPEIDPTTSENKEVNFVPRSLRNPNPVRPSDEIKEDARTIAIIGRTQTLHNEYIAQQTKNIVELSALEITIRKENMLSTFLDIAFKYAKALAIKRVAGTEDDNLPIRKAFAISAAKHAIHMMADMLKDSTLD